MILYDEPTSELDPVSSGGGKESLKLNRRIGVNVRGGVA